MTLQEILALADTGKAAGADPEAMAAFNHYADLAQQVTAQLNGSYHSQSQISDLFAKLTGHPTPEGFKLFPPFTTDFGRNIHIGENVFINSGCRFQDQGGIYIADGVQIGHNVVIATINHDMRPSHRADMYLRSVPIGRNAWIGSNATILPGISIGDGAVVGAGSVVTKDVPPMTIVAGNPAHVIRPIAEND